MREYNLESSKEREVNEKKKKKEKDKIRKIILEGNHDKQI